MKGSGSTGSGENGSGVGGFSRSNDEEEDT